MNGHHRKLTPDTAHAIRELYANGETQAAIAEAYHVTQACVSLVVTGRTWKTSGGPITPNRGHPRKLTIEDAYTIREQAATGATHATLAHTYGVSRSHISGIVTCYRWLAPRALARTS